MTSELVITPAWRRADFLSAALQRLALADDGKRRYWVCLDRGFSREVLPVATEFVNRVGARRAQIRRRSHRYKGNSYNVLTAYREVLATRADLIHLVEEDVFVGSDYFEAHRDAHALMPDAFSVSACRNQQFPPGVDPPDDDTAAYGHVSYQSIGVSFRTSRVEEVVRMATRSYFTNPVAYCRKHWPNSAINPANAEQDGLIHRMIEAASAETAYLAVPRAYHAGFVGYHRRGLKLAGSVGDRAARLLSMTTAELNDAAHSYPDHQAVDLDAPRKPVSQVIAWPT